MPVSTFHYGKFIISVYNSIKSDLVKKWDEMDTGSLNSSYLSLLEDTKPKDVGFRYVIIEEDVDSEKEIRAIIYFQLLKFSGKNIHFPKSVLLSVLTSVILSLRPFRILICGNLFAVNFPAIKCNRDHFDIKTLIFVLSEIGNREKNDIFILKDLDAMYSIPVMKEFGWNPYSSDMTMVLNMNPSWKNLDDYLQDLGKKYKKRLMKIISAGKKLIRKDMNAEEIRENKNQILNLFRQVVSKQTVRMGQIGDDYFYEYKKRFSDLFFFTGYFYGDELVAFSSYIDHGNMLEIHYIGINYIYNTELMIYFNILSDGVGKAIKMSKSQLELGRTAREAKANMGSVPVYFNDFIQYKNRLAFTLSKISGKYFLANMGEKWTGKHPFAK